MNELDLSEMILSPDVSTEDLLRVINNGTGWRRVAWWCKEAMLSSVWLGRQIDWNAVTDAIRRMAARFLRERFPDLEVQVRGAW